MKDEVDEQDTGTPAVADADLVLRTRSGDADAFGELWRRHYRSGMTVARSITSSIDADDLVQESYARIYQAILKGGGPNGSFRAYLFTSIRNTAAAWGRARRETTLDELETVADPASSEAAADEQLDRSLTAQAFRSLPSRWQEVLWYSEIEQLKPAAIGTLLGMSAGAVSQLTFRAREGLREAWIQAHLRSVGEGSECQWTIEHLGAYARGNLGVRAQQRADRHLQECARCMIVAAEAKDVSSRLALVLLPLVLGVTGASGYLAALQGGGAPIVALAAMPSSVVHGAVTVGPAASGGAVHAAGGSHAAGTGGGASGAAGGAGAGVAGSGVGGAGLSGIGALVGAGSAALVVAGVVAAVAVMPSVFGGSPVTSLPSAAEAEPSSISSAEVTPDSTMSADDPMVIDVGDPAPPTPKSSPDVDEPVDATEPPQNAEVVLPPEPEFEPSPAPEPPAEPSPEPEDQTDEGSPAPDPGTSDPDTGTTDPGTTDPGTTDPAPDPDEGITDPDPGTTDPDTGMTDPAPDPDEGTTDPDEGTTDPDEGTTDPDEGTTDPDEGTTDPDEGTTDPDDDATEPGDDATEPDDGTTDPVESRPLTWGSVSTWFEGSTTHYSLPIQGTPGATVQAWMDGEAGGDDEIVLDDQGKGVVDLRPSLEQAFVTSLGLRYVIDGVPGEWTELQVVLLGIGTTPPAEEGSATPGDETPAPDADTDPDADEPEQTTPGDAADAPADEPSTTDDPAPTDDSSTDSAGTDSAGTEAAGTASAGTDPADTGSTDADAADTAPADAGDASASEGLSASGEDDDQATPADGDATAE
ncbi:sigma-70 family RNA polymerase sigma factor [Microbacterium sp. ARD32]|uniref:sigma-70 family RNA polymerase sigma factor n=1 Tax=Microbacterium sp. ARD32 TaxID=2962577 RepID=UPI00288148B5|nr:sigma-70 family RNA polymerase sigma factor [Microbacterium sp. ARD32]MDT0156501.1 sigma-70 family RNA polymerase sigma factor [Microbacterium sp. ARD32]